MKKLIGGLATAAIAVVVSVPLTARADDLSKETLQLCVPERMEGSCEAPSETLTFPVVPGATAVSVVVKARSDNEAQVEECAVADLFGATGTVCTIRPDFPSQLTLTAAVAPDQHEISVVVRHLAAADFPAIDSCPWDEDAPWRFQPTMIGDEIHGCTPGSMHVLVSAAFTIPSTTTEPAPTTTVPPTTVPPTTVAPPTTTAPVATEPEVAPETIAVETDPAAPAPTLPNTGAATWAEASLGVFAIAVGSLIMIVRRRHFA